MLDANLTKRILALMEMATRGQFSEDEALRNEASVAYAKAQQLLLKHNLELSQLLATKQECQIKIGMTTIPIHRPGENIATPIVWRRMLANVVAEFYLCKGYSLRSQQLLFVGTEFNRELAIQGYQSLVTQILEIAKQHYQVAKTTQYDLKHNRSWYTSFYAGAVQGFWLAFKAARHQETKQKTEQASTDNAPGSPHADSNPNALIVIQHEEAITAFTQKQFGKIHNAKGSRHKNIARDAFDQGFAEGSKLHAQQGLQSSSNRSNKELKG